MQLIMEVFSLPLPQIHGEALSLILQSRDLQKVVVVACE